jgi:outer membrane protein assembly factor BamA
VVQYTNIKRRFNWGAVAFDQRDYFLLADNAGNISRDQIQRTSGANMFIEYPFSRFYRVEGSVGVLDGTQDDLVGTTPSGIPQFFRTSSTHATARVGLVGDTTRYMQYGPVQGKRFSISAFYGAHISGDTEGDILQYNVDFRTYKQLTRRSTLAWRVGSTYGDGDRVSFQGFGGINQLRGFEYREFFGSKIAWSNLELRFPLLEALPFTFGNLGPVRGFLFFDIGAAALPNDLFYDPNYVGSVGGVRVDPLSGEPIPFSFWDDENDRLQDGRASYGSGFQAFILGLQMNWSWARQMDYTQYAIQFDDLGNPTGISKTRANTGGTRMDFYIVFDF